MTQSNPPRALRRNYMINPRFQLKVIAFFALLALLNSGVIFLAFMEMLRFFNAQAMELSQGREIVLSFIQLEKTYMTQVYFVISAIVFVYFLIGGLFISHHIAGPIYALGKNIRELVRGEPLRPVEFRKRDFFYELQDDYNALLDKIKDKL